MTHVCAACLVEKTTTDFYSRYKTCKRCILDRQKTRHLLNKDIRRKQSASRYAKNKEVILRKNKEYRESHKESFRRYSQKWQHDNLDKRKLYYENNKKYIMKKVHEWSKKKKATDPVYKLKISLRYRIFEFLKSKGLNKKNRTNDLLGTSYETVKKHIERQFKKGMTWENHGNKGWHIDHIIPLSSAKTEEELIKLFHYTNLQPLWAIENIRKKAKIPQVQIKLTI